MSLLLEALKKAALEKQSKADDNQLSGAVPISPSLGDTLDHNSHIEPITDQESESQQVETVETPDFKIEKSELSSENESESDAQEDELVFEPEFESIENENESVGNLDFTEPEDFELEAEEETSEESDLAAEDLIDQEEIEAARIKLEQEQALEEQRQLLEEERNRKEQEQKQEEEQERLRLQEIEQKRQEQAEKNEQARQVARNREALDQLITSGKNIEQKAKRRAAFLYLLLLFTAVGGLSAYYVFLIANTGKTELQNAVDLDTNPDIVDVVEMLQTDAMSAGAQNSDASTNSSIEDQTKPLEGQVGQLDQTPISIDPVSQTVSIETEATSETASPPIAETRIASSQGNQLSIATRVDPPPSASAYLHPLILSSSGQVQNESLAERVIIHHEAKPATISELISDAYNALQSGELSKANKLYRKALEESPDQRDAILGVAATATAMGKFDEALSLYQRRLLADPNDTYARSGMLGLVNDSASRNNVIQEIERLLREHPDSAQLHFSKGIGLTFEKDWQSAQVAFYEAYRLDNGNPDFAYNLAISLDHLKQPGLARVYYERALSLIKDRPSNFNELAARQRVTELTNE